MRSSRPRPSATARNRGSIANASRRLRWLSRLIVVDLAERVLAVEHPAVGARQQRVGDVAEACSTEARGRVAGPVPWIHWRRRSAGMSRAVEPAGPGVLDPHRGAGDGVAGAPGT